MKVHHGSWVNQILCSHKKSRKSVYVAYQNRIYLQLGTLILTKNHGQHNSHPIAKGQGRWGGEGERNLARHITVHCKESKHIHKKSLCLQELVWKRATTADGMHFGSLPHGTEDLKFTHFQELLRQRKILNSNIHFFLEPSFHFLSYIINLVANQPIYIRYFDFFFFTNIKLT